MPLNREDRQRVMNERFESSVGGLTDRKKIPPGFIDGLMMGGIDEGAASV